MTSKAKHGTWRQLDRALWRQLVTAGIKPTVSGETVFCDTRADQVCSSKIVYVQPTQSLADALIVEKVMEAIISEIPVGRLGTVEEVSRIVTFLASDDAGFITGSTISANGGQYFA